MYVNMNAHVHGTSIQSSETVLRAAELFRESRNDYTEMRYGSVSCGTIIMSRGIVPRAAERLYRATERLYKAAEQYKSHGTNIQNRGMKPPILFRGFV